MMLLERLTMIGAFNHGTNTKLPYAHPVLPLRLFHIDDVAPTFTTHRRFRLLPWHALVDLTRSSLPLRLPGSTMTPWSPKHGPLDTRLSGPLWSHPGDRTRWFVEQKRTLFKGGWLDENHAAMMQICAGERHHPLRFLFFFVCAEGEKMGKLEMCRSCVTADGSDVMMRMSREGRVSCATGISKGVANTRWGKPELNTQHPWYKVHRHIFFIIVLPPPSRTNLTISNRRTYCLKGKLRIISSYHIHFPRKEPLSTTRQPSPSRTSNHPAQTQCLRQFPSLLPTSPPKNPSNRPMTSIILQMPWPHTPGMWSYRNSCLLSQLHHGVGYALSRSDTVPFPISKVPSITPQPPPPPTQRLLLTVPSQPNAHLYQASARTRHPLRPPAHFLCSRSHTSPHARQ